MRQYVLINKQVVPDPDLFRWSKAYESMGNRRVAFDQIGTIEVSTVFLGLDHDFSYVRQGEGPNPNPIVFETMAFNMPGGDRPCFRYRTWEEAEAGHNAFVATLTVRQRENGVDCSGISIRGCTENTTIVLPTDTTPEIIRKIKI